MPNIELKGLKGLKNIHSLANNCSVVSADSDNLKKISIDLLKPGKYQPRGQIQNENLTELVSSIKAQGIIQPLIVRSTGKEYEIIAGERRWRAARLASLSHVPVIIRDIDDSVALAFALIENIQRENLNPIEEAVAFNRFKKEFNMSQADIASMVGCSRSSVANTIRLLTLSDPVKSLLEKGEIEMGHARAILTLTSNNQMYLAKKIIKERLTVRDAEKLAQIIKLTPGAKNGIELEQQNLFSNDQEKCKYWSRELSKILPSKVTVKLNRNGAGRIVIHVDSLDEIEWLFEHINSD